LQAAPIWYNQHTIGVTFSAGIACSAEVRDRIVADCSMPAA
jgi:hypothetical protein